MRLKIFTQPSCPHCPPAKELGKRLEKQIEVEYLDITTPAGLAEANFYSIWATPTLILTDAQERELKRWEGTPTEEEVLDEIKRGKD